MHRNRITRRLSYANVIASLALFIALGGASYAAVAIPANSVGTKQLKKSAVAGSKIKPNAISSAKVKDGSLQRGDFASGTLLQGPQSAQGAKGDPGQNGAPGAKGESGEPGTARAYGHVLFTGKLSRSKNVASVTNPSTGRFCIALAPSIDPATTGLVATPDFESDSTIFGANQPQTIVEFDSGGFGCPAATLEVVTGRRDVLANGSPDGDVRSVHNALSNQSFFFLVP
jgi:hypothetical protein